MPTERPKGWSEEDTALLQQLLEAWRLRWRPGEASLMSEDERYAMQLPVRDDGVMGPHTRLIISIFRRAHRKGWA